MVINSEFPSRKGVKGCLCNIKFPGMSETPCYCFLASSLSPKQSVPTGLFLGLLSMLNLYIVYKLDLFSRYEGQLAHELQMTKMREELALAQNRLRELEGKATGSPSAPSAQ